MLKITIHDGAKMFRLQLEGRLASAWVTELEQCWRTAASMLDEKVLVVNLDDVSFVDASGMSLLADMNRAGAKFTAATPYQKEVVAEITGKPVTETDETPSRNPWLRKMVSAFFFLAVLMILQDVMAMAQEQGVLRLTMKDAVNLALKQNPQVQIANLNVALSQQDEVIARSSLLPQVRGEASESIRKSNLETNFGRR